MHEIFTLEPQKNHSRFDLKYSSNPTQLIWILEMYCTIVVVKTIEYSSSVQLLQYIIFFCSTSFSSAQLLHCRTEHYAKSSHVLPQHDK